MGKSQRQKKKEKQKQLWMPPLLLLSPCLLAGVSRFYVRLVSWCVYGPGRLIRYFTSGRSFLRIPQVYSKTVFCLAAAGVLRWGSGQSSASRRQAGLCHAPFSSSFSRRLRLRQLEWSTFSRPNRQTDHGVRFRLVAFVTVSSVWVVGSDCVRLLER